MTDSRYLRDRAALLIAAGRAAETLEARARTTEPTVTLSRDEAQELAAQFGRVVALLTVFHINEAQAAKERAAA